MKIATVTETADATLVVPIVHLNGTSANSLVEDRLKAYAAIGEAYDALKQMGPNGRDYYPQPGLMQLAIEQHRRRLLVLDALRAEIEAECEAINEQEAERCAP